MLEFKRLEVDVHPIAMAPGIHAAVDETEVTARCFKAVGGTSGVAYCFALGEDGRFIIDGDHVVREELVGEVRLWFDGDEVAYAKAIELERRRDNVVVEGG